MFRLLIGAATAGLLAAAAIPGADAAELLYVFEPGCPYCRLWDREIAPVYLKTEEAGRAALQPIDRNDPVLAGMKLASPVRYTPTFVLMENGAELGRIEGYPGEDFFWGRLAALIKRLPAAAQ
jgi:hypothetical protein